MSNIILIISAMGAAKVFSFCDMFTLDTKISNVLHVCFIVQQCLSLSLTLYLCLGDPRENRVFLRPQRENRQSHSSIEDIACVLVFKKYSYNFLATYVM